MAIDKFIPKVWSAKLLLELRKALVYGQAGVINRDYQGEIRNQGDAVKVHSFGPVSVFDYDKNTDIAPPETLSDDEVMLLINQAKAFNFQIDDIDKAQQSPKIMTKVIADAAYRLADAADKYIASLYTDAGQTLGSDAAPIVPNADTAYELLVDVGTMLSEKTVPAQGRFVIIPPWLYGMLLKDSRFSATGGTSAEDTLKNGQVGMAAGFAVLQSNNIPNIGGEKYKILAGTSAAWSFADQIASLEAYRPEKRFADAVKGLHVYGAKVFLPDALVCVTADKK